MIIKISIKNRVAEYVPGDTPPVCGNDGDSIAFSFDAEWDAYEEKTARFTWGGNKFHDERFVGASCPVPAFLNTTQVQVGVLAGSDEARLSSTRATVPYLLSARCGGGKPSAESTEAYTHRALEAAESAASSVASCEQYAAEAGTHAVNARSNAMLALDFSERAEAVAYDLEAKNVEGRLNDHNWRLALIENHIGFDSPLRIIKGQVDSVEIPENSLQYASISKLECVLLPNVYSDGWYGQGVRAIRVLDADGNELRRIDVPVSLLPDYGQGTSYSVGSKPYSEDKQNYIAFRNGRAYYHHNVYTVYLDEEYSEDYTKRNEGDTWAEGMRYQVLLKMAEPEVIDITEALGFDGYLDVSGGAQIVFDQILLKDCEEVMNGMVSLWLPARVYMLIETA